MKSELAVLVPQFSTDLLPEAETVGEIGGRKLTIGGCGEVAR
jgi:hypothetical protein